MIDARLAIAGRDLSALSREKTIVLALIIQLFVAAFSSFLVVGLTSLYDPNSVSGGQVEVAVTGNASDELLAAARDQNGITAIEFEGPGAATAAFEANRVDAVVRTSYRDGRIAVTATAPADSLRKTLVVVKLRALFETFERQEREERAAFLDHDLVPLPPEVDASPYFGFTYTVLVPLLMFLPVFISGSLVVDSVTEEVERGTLELLRVAPLSLGQIVDGKALAAVALAPTQAALWLLLLSFNGISLANVGWLLVLVTALALGLVAYGVVLSLLVPVRQRAQLLYSLGILAIFGLGVYLPEHPATTTARLAIGSPGPLTVPLVVGYAVLAVAIAAGVRLAVVRIDVETL